MMHADLLSLLLPPVSYDPNGERLASELQVEGRALDAAEANARRVLDAITPFGAPELLKDWERNYGLSDGDQQRKRSLQERMAALLQRINEQGGLSREYFIFLALRLGYSVNVIEFRPFRSGRSKVGDPIYGDDWMFAWRIHAPAATILPFRAGLSMVGEPLAKWSNELLERALKTLAPAHSILQFTYGGDPSLQIDEDGDGFLIDEENDYLDLS